MDFSTQITGLEKNISFNSINDYNQFLQGNASFDVEKTQFDDALENASKNIPIKDKHDPVGLGNFASNIGDALSSSLNAVNNARLTADRMQEDIAMGGSTNIHDAMIAAEKATLSMQMAVQVRNRIISAYTDITSMAI